MGNNPFQIGQNPGVMTANNDLQYIAKVPTGYGGITVIAAQVVNGAATDSGTSFVAHLMNYGTSGTVAGGTIGSAGGTAAPYAADTPLAFTLTAAQVFVDEGEWIVLKKTQEGADSDFNAQACVDLWAVWGVISQG